MGSSTSQRIVLSRTECLLNSNATLSMYFTLIGWFGENKTSGIVISLLFACIGLVIISLEELLTLFLLGDAKMSGVPLTSRKLESP